MEIPYKYIKLISKDREVIKAVKASGCIKKGVPFKPKFINTKENPEIRIPKVDVSVFIDGIIREVLHFGTDGKLYTKLKDIGLRTLYQHIEKATFEVLPKIRDMIDEDDIEESLKNFGLGKLAEMIVYSPSMPVKNDKLVSILSEIFLSII